LLQQTEREGYLHCTARAKVGLFGAATSGNIGVTLALRNSPVLQRSQRCRFIKNTFVTAE